MKHIVTIFLFINTILFFNISQLQSQDLSGLRICIDPGHGIDKSVESSEGLSEYDINRQVAQFLVSYLKSANADTIIITTPQNGKDPGLSAREDMVNQEGVDWYHSVHHNSFDGSFRYTLVLYEQIGEKDSRKLQGQADVLSAIMSENIYNSLGTSDYYAMGDQIFYKNHDEGFPVHILKNLQMPGEISQATFFDHEKESNRLKNPDCLRLEALAIYKSFLEFFEGKGPKSASLSGTIYDTKTNKPINEATVHIEPLDLDYTTDRNHNGFYAFWELEPGQYSIEAKARGYKPQKDSVTVSSDKFFIYDLYLSSNKYPVVKTSFPLKNAIDFSPYDYIDLSFNHSMNTLSVENAISVAPEFSYQITWLDHDSTLRIDPNPVLQFNTNYEITIDTTAQDIFEHPIDGNGDGVINTPFVLNFKTKAIDKTVPQVLSTHPIDSDSGVFIGEPVRICFNKPLQLSSINENNLYITGPSDKKIECNRIVTPTPSGRQIVQLVPSEPFRENSYYEVTLSSSVSDSSANKMKSAFQFGFLTQRSNRDYYVIDHLNRKHSAWGDPIDSPATKNIFLEHTRWTHTEGPIFRDRLSVARLDYGLRSDGLIDIPLVGQLDGYQKLRHGEEVGTYIFGDSSRTRFRFYFNDQADGLEAGQWNTIDWHGWKAVRFKVGSDSLFSYREGNGFFDDEVGLTGIQLHSSWKAAGTIYFDDFFLTSTYVSAINENEEEEANQPEEYILIQSYPNPFSRKMNHTGVSITYEFPQKWGQSKINLSIYNTLGQKIRELVNQEHQPGRYEAFWDGLDEFHHAVPAGVYFYRIQVGKHAQTRRLVVLN